MFDNQDRNEIHSAVLYSNFGIFTKPDSNVTNLTYNFPPKPIMLGIFGAITGYSGYGYGQEGGPKILEFMEKFNNLFLGITPLERTKQYIYEGTDENLSKGFRLLSSPYNKQFVKFNNYHGYGHQPNPGDPGGVWNIREQILLNPAFRVYFYSRENGNPFKKLVEKLSGRKTHFTPYMGKNEFPLSIIYEGTREVEFIDPGSDATRGTECSTILFDDAIESTYWGYKSPQESEKRIDMIESYPYGFVDQQYTYRYARFTTKKLDLNQETLNDWDNEILLVRDSDDDLLFLF